MHHQLLSIKLLSVGFFPHSNAHAYSVKDLCVHTWLKKYAVLRDVSLYALISQKLLSVACGADTDSLVLRYEAYLLIFGNVGCPIWVNSGQRNIQIKQQFEQV